MRHAYIAIREYMTPHIYNKAYVFDDAAVTQYSCIFGNARIYGNARVYRDAKVSGNAWIEGNAWIAGNAVINEKMKVLGERWIKSPDQIYYVDGITAYFDEFEKLMINGTRKPGYHETLARLKLS